MPTTDHDVLSLSCALVEQASVTPEDSGCQAIMSSMLNEQGFVCEDMPFEEVSNLWAVHGDTGPLFVFAGHTDVVPTGPEHIWDSPPFIPEVREGLLFGRGTADMKCSLAAMLLATQAFVKDPLAKRIRVGYLITSDEEGPAKNGTVKVMEALAARGEHIDYCVVGEPSSSERLGDVVKNGRRGSFSAHLKIEGVQGHIAYPHLADNPIHKGMPALSALAAEVWDDGDEFFQPSSFQISNLHSGTGAGNVIPGHIDCHFNIRFSPALEPEDIQARVARILDAHELNYSIDWTLNGRPFITREGLLLGAVTKGINEVCGIAPEISTGGGTSDGRFIAPYGVELVELGPSNGTIHKVNEHVRVDDLEPLRELYLSILKHVAAGV